MTSAASSQAGLSVLFSAGGRPRVEDIVRLSTGPEAAGFPFAVNQADAGQAEAGQAGWTEILASGLAFDCGGLAPGQPDATPQVDFLYGLESDQPVAALEAVTLRPGPHLAGAENLMPVVRTMCGIAVALSQLPQAVAVAWHPARTALSCLHFQRLVSAWLAGGAFPALGLTALSGDADGALGSFGLSYFTGRELRIEPLRQGNPANLARIAVRLIHRLVEGEGVTSPGELIGPEGERLCVEVSADGRVLRVWQKA